MNLLIKFSGEFFDSKDSLSNIGKEFLESMKDVERAYVVIGGGNRIRGRSAAYHRPGSDRIGVLSTLMNGFILKEYLENTGRKVAIFSHFADFGRVYDYQQAKAEFEDHKWVIFAGGLGRVAYVSTDVNSVIKALEVGANAVVKLTKEYGVYDKDPSKFEDANLIPHLSHEEVLARKLPVMDYAAIAIAAENNLPIAVMNVLDLPRFLANENVGSIIGNDWR
jgi:uridylate kinase